MRQGEGGGDEGRAPAQAEAEAEGQGAELVGEAARLVDEGQGVEAEAQGQGAGLVAEAARLADEAAGRADEGVSRLGRFLKAIFGVAESAENLREPSLVETVFTPIRDVHHVVVSRAVADKFPPMHSHEGHALLQFFVWRRAVLALMLVVIPLSTLWQLAYSGPVVWEQVDPLQSAVESVVDRLSPSYGSNVCPAPSTAQQVSASVCEGVFGATSCSEDKLKEQCGSVAESCCCDPDGSCDNGSELLCCLLDAPPHSELAMCRPGQPVVQHVCVSDADHAHTIFAHNVSAVPRGSYACKSDAQIVSLCGSLELACCADQDGSCTDGDEAVFCIDTSTFNANEPAVFDQLDECTITQDSGVACTALQNCTSVCDANGQDSERCAKRFASGDLQCVDGTCREVDGFARCSTEADCVRPCSDRGRWSTDDCASGMVCYSGWCVGGGFFVEQGLFHQMDCGTLCDQETVADRCGEGTSCQCATSEGVCCARRGQQLAVCWPDDEGTIRTYGVTWNDPSYQCGDIRDADTSSASWYLVPANSLLNDLPYNECAVDTTFVSGHFAQIGTILQYVGADVPMYSNLTCENGVTVWHTYADEGCRTPLGDITVVPQCLPYYINISDASVTDRLELAVHDTLDRVYGQAFSMLVDSSMVHEIQEAAANFVTAGGGQCAAGTPEEWGAFQINFGFANVTMTGYGLNSTKSGGFVDHFVWAYEKFLRTDGYRTMAQAVVWITFLSEWWRWGMGLLAVLNWADWRKSARLNMLGWGVPLLATFALFIVPLYAVNNMNAEKFIEELLRTLCMEDNLVSMFDLLVYATKLLRHLDDTRPDIVKGMLLLTPFKDLNEMIGQLDLFISNFQNVSSGIVVTFGGTVAKTVALLYFAFLAVASAVPIAFALLPGLRRGALAMKLILPQSTFIGWVYFIVPFLYIPLVLSFAMFVIQVLANGWITGAVLLYVAMQALDPLLLGRFVTLPFLSWTDFRECRGALPRTMDLVRKLCAIGIVGCVVAFVVEMSLFKDVLHAATIHPSALVLKLLRFVSNYLLTAVAWADILLYITLVKHVDGKEKPGADSALAGTLDQVMPMMGKHLEKDMRHQAAALIARPELRRRRANASFTGRAKVSIAV